MARILAVEDEIDLCDLLKEELEAEGHEVMTAHDGIQALQALGSFVPEIVISDVSMPGLDGFGLLEEFRAKYPSLADTPFMFLTALKSREDEIRAREFGVDDYMTKPVDFDMLHSVLATRLRQVSRMRERKEQQMVKLYKALSPATDAAADGLPTGLESCGEELNLTEALGIETGADTSDQVLEREVPAKPEPRRLFGSLFRFPNLKRATQEAPGGGKSLRERTIGRAIEILKGLLYEECVASRMDDEALVVSYLDADDVQAAEMAEELRSSLQEKLLEDQADIWKSEFELDEDAIAMALVVSEALFEIELSPEDCDAEDFEQAVRDTIEKTRVDPRAPGLLVTSIRKDGGRLLPLTMVARNGDSLPIRFFSYDDASKRKLRAGFAFFGKNNREKASYLVDVMTLELMEGADDDLVKSDIAVVDVHFMTLASSIYYPTFIRKFLQFAKHAPYSFMLNIRSVPSGLSAADLKDILRPLGKYATRRSVQIEPEKFAAVVRSRLSVSCVVCSYPELSASAVSASTFREHKPTLTKSGALLVLRGLGGEEEIEAVKDFGFDGYAIDDPATSQSDAG